MHRQSLASSGIVAFILICLKANSQNWKHVGDTCQRKKMLGTRSVSDSHDGYLGEFLHSKHLESLPLNYTLGQEKPTFHGSYMLRNMHTAH